MERSALGSAFAASAAEICSQSLNRRDSSSATVIWAVDRLDRNNLRKDSLAAVQ
jgi:hypothetical protein